MLQGIGSDSSSPKEMLMKCILDPLEVTSKSFLTSFMPFKLYFKLSRRKLGNQWLLMGKNDKNKAQPLCFSIPDMKQKTQRARRRRRTRRRGYFFPGDSKKSVVLAKLDKNSFRDFPN